MILASGSPLCDRQNSAITARWPQVLGPGTTRLARIGHALAARVLIVSYVYPPAASVGGVRWSTMAKYLRGAGHHVTVLTSAAFGERDDDNAMAVRRTGDLSGSSRLRRLLRRPALASSAAPDAVQTAPPRVLTRLLVPDGYIASWVPFAVREARRIVRSEQIDCVITSSPPESAHMVGLALGARGPAWIADLRDGWTFEAHRQPFPLRIQRALDARLEAAVIKRAEGVTSALMPVARDLEARFGRTVRHVPNGWDPELVPRRPAIELAPDMVNVVHTGTLVGAGFRRDPTSFFRALELLLKRRPELGHRIRIVVAGVKTTEDAALLRRFELGEVVQHVGRLPREEAVWLQRQADILLLLSSAPHLVSPVPAKLYEYLAADAPVLAVAPPGSESARVVDDTGAGLCVSPYDDEALVTALERAAAGELRRRDGAAPASDYIYPAPAEAMMDEIDAAIAATRLSRR
jgi:glycosyltransferase involved in cell wall biosynthesis